MSRSRAIKPGFFSNDALAECEPLARLLFAGLWTIADREGRLEDRPKKIKAEILPYDDCNIDSLLSQLTQHGFITRYKSGENGFIQVNNFTKHQNPHIKETASSIPAPDKHGASTVQAQTQTGTSRASSLLPLPSSLNLEVTTEDKSSYVTPRANKKPSSRSSKPSLEELTTDHVREWLAEKRTQGRYLSHDESFILEYFKNYCKSKGKRYDDYIAAYRNAFEWDNCQPGATNSKQAGQRTNGSPQQDRRSEKQRAVGAYDAIIEARNAGTLRNPFIDPG